MVFMEAQMHLIGSVNIHRYHNFKLAFGLYNMGTEGQCDCEVKLICKCGIGGC